MICGWIVTEISIYKYRSKGAKLYEKIKNYFLTDLRKAIGDYTKI